MALREVGLEVEPVQRPVFFQDQLPQPASKQRLLVHHRARVAEGAALRVCNRKRAGLASALGYTVSSVSLSKSGLKIEMDAFESLIATLLSRDGYWVQSRVKVDLTPADKRAIGRPSAPRWELDLVAYKGAANHLLIVECKSFLNSRGVTAASFDGRDPRSAERFKLFNDVELKKRVLRRLVTKLVEVGSCAPSPSTRLCLAAGRIASESDREGLTRYFEKRGWLLLDDGWLRQRLHAAANEGYQDDLAIITAKMLSVKTPGR